MLNRELRPVTVITYSDEVDKYGQKRQGASSTRTVNMFVKMYSNSIENNPRFNDIDYIGLTWDKNISSENQIQFDNKTCNVKYMIPSGRLSQIFMKVVDE